MDKSIILSELKKAKPILSNKYGLTTLALFGSYSRNEQTINSDVDLMVDFDTISYSNFYDCVIVLKRLFQNKKVDVVTKGGIKPKYFEAIKDDLIYA